MSCFKCGRDLPVGQVECEGDCVTATGAAAPTDSASHLIVRVVLDLHLKPGITSDPNTFESFQAAMARLSGDIMRSIDESGVKEFCTRIGL